MNISIFDEVAFGWFSANPDPKPEGPPIEEPGEDSPIREPDEPNPVEL